MIDLLRFHFHFSKWMVVFSALIVAGFIILHTGDVIYLPMTLMILLLLMFIPAMSSTYLLNEQVSYIVRLLPVTYRQFVQSAYLYAALVFAFIFIPAFLIIAYQFVNGDAGNFKLSFLLGVVAYCIVATGGILNSYFKHPAQADKNRSTADTFLYLLLTAIPHTFLAFLFSLIDLTVLGALIVPLCSIFAVYRFYKASIRHFEQAEY